MTYIRPTTLGLFYFIKFAELVFLTIWTVLMIGSGTWLMQRIGKDNDKSDPAKTLLIMIPVCLVLAVLNLFYNNLLINIRFSTNLKSRTLGLCIYKYVNWLICHCILEKPCKDRCFTGWTIGNSRWICASRQPRVARRIP